MVTVGGRSPTTTRMLARERSPKLSRTEAVMVCEPGGRMGATVAPVPRLPVMLELHVMRFVRLPSSASVAVAVKVTGASLKKCPPVAGAVMVTCGGC